MDMAVDQAVGQLAQALLRAHRGHDEQAAVDVLSAPVRSAPTRLIVGPATPTSLSRIDVRSVTVCRGPVPEETAGSLSQPYGSAVRCIAESPLVDRL